MDWLIMHTHKGFARGFNSMLDRLDPMSSLSTLPCFFVTMVISSLVFLPKNAKY